MKTYIIWKAINPNNPYCEVMGCGMFATCILECDDETLQCCDTCLIETLKRKFKKIA